MVAVHKDVVVANCEQEPTTKAWLLTMAMVDIGRDMSTMWGGQREGGALGFESGVRCLVSE